MTFDPATFDPNADPLSDPALAELVAGKLVRAADHPWELERPPDFDPIAAAGRFLTLAREVEEIAGQPCEIELWPRVKAATFHGELVLPAAALRAEGFAVVRASNFGDLIAVLNDETAVRPDVLAALRRRFDRNRYKFVPAALVRRPYAGHHRGTRRFGTWADRLFGYL